MHNDDGDRVTQDVGHTPTNRIASTLILEIHVMVN